jgi:nucleosome binding factor SPN SPT16 subunit
MLKVHARFNCYSFAIITVHARSICYSFAILKVHARSNCYSFWQVLRIDAIPSKALDTIKDWLNSVNIKYYESKLNLAWKPILK